MTGIYRITLGVTTIAWLCLKHLAAKLAQGWSADKIGDTEFACDGCEIERQGGAA